MESGFSNAWALGANLAEQESWGSPMESQICVEEGVEDTQPYRGGGGLSISSVGYKTILDGSRDGGKMASVSRRERRSVLRGSCFSLREMPS